MDKTIIKLIKECSDKNYAKASNIVNSLVEKKIAKILRESEEELLELDDLEEQEDKEAKTESEEEEKSLTEETDHQAKFKALLDEFGVTSPASLSDEEKSKFFNKLKESYSADEDEVKTEADEEDDVVTESDEEDEVKTEADDEDQLIEAIIKEVKSFRF